MDRAIFLKTLSWRLLRVVTYWGKVQCCQICQVMLKHFIRVGGQLLIYFTFFCTQSMRTERSSLPGENFPCISMDVLKIGALVLLGRLIEAI